VGSVAFLIELGTHAGRSVSVLLYRCYESMHPRGVRGRSLEQGQEARLSARCVTVAYGHTCFHVAAEAKGPVQSLLSLWQPRCI